MAVLTSKTLRAFAVALAAILATGALAGCVGDAANVDGDAAAGTGTQKIVVGSPGGWTGEEIRSQMVAKVLDKELGYEVELIEKLQAGIIYSSLAEGDINVFVGAWLPLQQASFDAQPAGSITVIGDNLPADSVTLSLAVPQYVYDAGVTSLADLDAHKDKFNGKIMGIEPGAGMMQVAKERAALDVYGLADWEIVDASTPAMLAAYDDAVENGEWIVIMMWAPHFAYAKWDGDKAVTDLADPGHTVDGETTYLYADKANRVQTLVNTGFEGEFPEAAAFLKRFSLTIEEENALMFEVDQGKSVEQAAQGFLDAHPDRVATWLGK